MNCRDTLILQQDQHSVNWLIGCRMCYGAMPSAAAPRPPAKPARDRGEYAPPRDQGLSQSSFVSQPVIRAPASSGEVAPDSPLSRMTHKTSARESPSLRGSAHKRASPVQQLRCRRKTCPTAGRAGKGVTRPRPCWIWKAMLPRFTSATLSSLGCPVLQRPASPPDDRTEAPDPYARSAPGNRPCATRWR